MTNLPASAHIETARDAYRRKDLWCALDGLRLALAQDGQPSVVWREGFSLARELGDDFTAVEFARRQLRDAEQKQEAAC